MLNPIRHLLQELAVPSFVPNDIALAGGPGEINDPNARNSNRSSQVTGEYFDSIPPSMLIMTGPNYSGKTVLLKQITLIVYMAHIGRSVIALLQFKNSCRKMNIAMFQRNLQRLV